LQAVISDMKEHAPATKYGIMFWGHGTGYVQNGIEDTPSISTKSYGGESIAGKNYWMNTTTMASILKGQNFDWIYFDCCFMMGVEVVYELRDVTDCIIGSATEIPADGTRYDLILKHLAPSNSNTEAAAKSTFDYYDSLSGMYRTCTMSVVKTNSVAQLADVMKRVYAYGPVTLPDYIPQQFQTPSDHKANNWSYYDLKHYALAVAGDNLQLCTEIENAFSNTVTAAYATPKLWNEVALLNHSGLSTLIIESDDDPQLDTFDYRELSWWTDVVQTRFNKP
ncbi:MAG: clostripain-related cysteine peptidase, partial [Clostridiales bacterium]|nr:clostripain-related cysteine peptidase [Clostridiales bacterium]